MKKYLLPALIFALATSLALYNIGNFPKMIGDEGIYVSQAYWLAFMGKLGPYTYWYDHFPLGWAQIGLWQLLTGPTRFLASSVLSARVFMGLALAITTTLLYFLAKLLTKSKLAALLTSTIFILSPLTLTFGRMVLLDNLAVVWFLLSLCLLFAGPTRLRYLVASALTLSLAILTKESLLFFLPPYLFTMYHLNKNNPYKQHALLVGTTTLIFLLSFFPLLAVLKDELFPQINQVSFLNTVLFQAGRGSGIPFYQEGSHFRQMLNMWITIDPILIFLGLGSTILALLLPLPFPLKVTSIFSLFYLFFLMRGGQIYEFYVIPLIPLLTLNISLLMHHFSQITKTYLLSLLLFVSVLSYFFISGTYPFTSLATLPQIKSLEALLALPDNSVIIANNYPYLDVFLQGKNVIHWYQKIESDQTIQSSTGPITHILTDVQFVNELSADQLPFIKTQLERDSTKMEFGPLLAPGENVKPFSTENLTLYALSEAQDSLHYVLNLEGVTIDHLTQLSNNPPPAILITKSSFGSTSELESYLRELKALSNPSPKILVVQDDTGENTIPWITTPARSFYKSPEEAASSALKKTEALKNLGFSGAVITSTDNQDGYLSSIVQASSTNLIPILRYSAEIPALKTAILVTSKNDLETLTNSNYPGQIYYLVSLEEYRQISN